MVSEHKKIVLRQLDGLDALKFRMIKALLDKELKLTDKMQEDYDIIKIANMLEEKFPKDAGVNKLIEVCKNMPSLENLADKLKEEKEKVQNKNKRKSNGAQRKRKQDEPSTPQPVPAGCEASKTAPSAKKKKQKTTETQGSKKQKLTKMQNELLKSSVTNTQKEDCLHIPPMTPSTKSSNSAIKKRKSKSINTEDSKKINLAWEQDQLPEPSESNNLKTEDCLQTPHKPFSTSSSNSLTKKSKDTITKTQTILKIQEEHHILGLPTTSKYPAVFPKPVSTDLLASQVIPPTTSRNLAPLVPKATILKNQRIRVQDQAGTRSLALQKSTIIVKVLKATDLFEYESAEQSQNKMFHATVATERQFFHVKVFNIKLKGIFTKNNVITISNYTEYKGILVINEASCVSEAGCYQKIEIPNSVIRRANETPKIDDLLKRASGTLVYGLFQLHKKKVNPKNTIYEIQDNTGKMDVVGSGKCHNVQCKEGDKLRLFCFLIRKVDKQLKLVCENHSFIKVTRT